MATFLCPGLKCFQGSITPPFPPFFLQIFVFREIDFDPREPVSLITPRSFIIRRTLKNTRRVFVLLLTAHDYKYKWKGFDVWNG